MKKYSLRIPPEIEAFVRHLHPGIKAKIRSALEEIEKDPYLGKPLREPLEGMYSYRVYQYRIIYLIKDRDILVEVVDIAQRRIVYARVAAMLRKIRY